MSEPFSDIEAGGSALLVADENCSEALLDTLPQSVEVLTNRWGLYLHAQHCGLIAYFSDFDFSPVEVPKKAIYYRVSKEKPVTHHVIKSSFDFLKTDGKLFLWGEKKAGIKTYSKKANVLFSCAAQARKSGTDYVVVLEKTLDVPGELIGNKTTPKNKKTSHKELSITDGGITHYLDDKDYTQLRSMSEFQGVALFTKPGLFGWEKLDRGSVLLIDQLANFFSSLDQPPENLLDLGCGYGLLSVAAASYGVPSVMAVDNCAAAVMACGKNLLEPCQILYDSATKALANKSNFSGRVVAADCRESYRKDFKERVGNAYDVVLCNPPFHQGFDTERVLTEAFLNTAAGALKPHGSALFVTNRFIPLEKIAAQFFTDIEILDETRGFRVAALKGVKRQ